MFQRVTYIDQRTAGTKNPGHYREVLMRVKTKVYESAHGRDETSFPL